MVFSKVHANFIATFLEFLQSQDIGSLPIGNFKGNIDFSSVTDQQMESFKKMIESGEKIDHKLVKSVIENGITDQDVVALGYRKQQLEIFKKLLNNDGFIETYNKEEAKKYKEEKNPPITENSKDEKVWQYFFQKNPWIFGYGLDYRFIDSSNREVNMGYGNIDFASFHKFSVLVEIKTPNTDLVKKRKAKEKGEEKSPNRSDAWSLSQDLINAISQLLAYKTNWQIEFDNRDNREKYGDNPTADSKAILIIGKISNLTDGITEEKNKRIVKETFELFRRDSRNIDILTFDELYERAYFIVYDQLPEEQTQPLL